MCGCCIPCPSLPAQSRAADDETILLLCGLSLLAHCGLGAESSVPLLSVTPGAGGQVIGVPGASLPWLLLFPFLPALLLAFTAFTRIAVVLFLLRQGLGSHTAPPNLVLMGLAVLLTIFVMSPALKTINAEAYQPYLAGALSFNDAAEQAAQPLKSFMLRQTRAEDLDLFIGDDKTIDPKRVESVPLAALAPAFLTSELKTAFQIGFMVVLPFLVIDLVVAAVLTALGMIMLPPQLVSLPLKLLLFVTVDGWHLLVGSLIGKLSDGGPGARRALAGDADRRAGVAGGAADRVRHQPVPGRHADSRTHAVLRAQAHRHAARAGGAGQLDGRAAGRVRAHPADRFSRPGRMSLLQ